MVIDYGASLYLHPSGCRTGPHCVVRTGRFVMRFTRIFATVSLLGVLTTTAAFAQSATPSFPTPAQLHDQLNQQAIEAAASTLAAAATEDYNYIVTSADESGDYAVFLGTGGFTSEQSALVLASLQEAGWQVKPVHHFFSDGWLIQPAPNWNQSRRGNEPAELNRDNRNNLTTIPSVAAVLNAQTADMATIVDAALQQGNFGCGTGRYGTIDVEHFFFQAIGNTETLLANKGWNTKLISLGTDQNGLDRNLNRLSLCISARN
jgi:hypothetical protein